MLVYLPLLYHDIVLPLAISLHFSPAFVQFLHQKWLRLLSWITTTARLMA